MYEAAWKSTDRVAESLPPLSEADPFLFIDLTDGQGWAELESALPEGAVDDLTGDIV